MLSLPASRQKQLIQDPLNVILPPPLVACVMKGLLSHDSPVLFSMTARGGHPRWGNEGSLEIICGLFCSHLRKKINGSLLDEVACLDYLFSN